MKGKKGYCTWGEVRGFGPTLHRTREAAEKALAKDQADCAAIGNGCYSDRSVYPVVEGYLVGQDGPIRVAGHTVKFPRNS